MTPGIMMFCRISDLSSSNEQENVQALPQATQQSAEPDSDGGDAAVEVTAILLRTTTLMFQWTK